METKVNFFCIGTQKAGTTTLHDILKEHPEIYLPKKKEAHFFDKDDRYAKGIDWYYNEFYSNYNQQKIIGSFTPEYSFYPKVAKRIFNDLSSDIKFIFILRNPVDRALSHYNMSRGRRIETLNFFDALKYESKRIIVNEKSYNHFSYISRGNYLEQINRYRQYFPLNQFLFLDFDLHIKNNIGDTIIKIQRFLEINQIKLDLNIHSNKGFIVKNNYFTNLLKSKNSWTSFASTFFTENFKRKIKRKIIKYNTEENKYKFVINKNSKSELLSKYFMKDFDKLQKLTKLNLEHWRE